MLNLLGCDLPKNLVPPNENNPNGYWESEELISLNNEILALTGSSWQDLDHIAPNWFSSPEAEELHARAQEFLDKEFADSNLFVLKDPRICKILPFWITVFEASAIKPHVILPIRHPLETTSSSFKMKGLNSTFSQLLWLNYVLEAEYSSRGQLRCFTSYDNLLQNWQKVATKISETFSFKWPQIATQAEKISSFLSTEHRHFTEEKASFMADQSITSWLKETYEIMDKWAESRETKKDLITLDRIRAEFYAAMPAFKAMSQPVDHAGKRNVKLKNELNKKKEELEQEKKKLEEATNRLLDSERTSQSLNEELEQEKKKSEETTNRLLDTEKNLTECISKIEKMTVSAESLQQEKRILEKTNRSFKTRVEELLKEQQIYKKAELLNKAKLQEQSYQLDQLQTELSTAKKDISSMRNKLSGKKWLQRTSEILAINAGSTWENKLLSLLPARFFRDIQMKRLKREGLFDASAYLAAYPDVKKAGVEPLYHYIHHGMQERRTPTKSAKN
jgi:hypothetical protein